jgi:GNAT superfamily N-acetyltransferase
MFVRADWTRRGLGRRILEECEAAARREGYRQLALLATLPGVPLYLACGFEPLEQIEVALSDGVRLAAVSMETPIDPVEGANNPPEVGRELASSH